MHNEWLEDDEENEDLITQMRIDDITVKAVATPPEAMSEINLAYEVINLPGGRSAIVAVNSAYMESLSDAEDMDNNMRGVYAFGVTIGQVLTMTCLQLRGDF